MKSVKQPPFFRSPGTQRQTAKVSNIPTKILFSQDLISDSTWDIYEQLNNGGKCGDSVDGGMWFAVYSSLIPINSFWEKILESSIFLLQYALFEK